MLNLHKILSQNYNEMFVGSLNSWPSSSSKERLSKAKNNLKAANSQDINTTKVSHFWPPFLFCTQIYINNITEVHVFCISFLIIDNYILNTYIYLSIYSSTYQIAIIRTCPHLLQNIHVLSHLPKSIYKTPKNCQKSIMNDFKMSSKGIKCKCRVCIWNKWPIQPELIQVKIP